MAVAEQFKSATVADLTPAVLITTQPQTTGKEGRQMADDVQEQGIDLGEAMVTAMLAWADRNSRDVNTRVPIIALHFAVMTVLEQISPYEKRRAYADDLIRAI